MFSAARFSTLGPSSLPEEIPLCGNPHPLVAMKPFLTNQLLRAPHPWSAPGFVVYSVFCFSKTVSAASYVRVFLNLESLDSFCYCFERFLLLVLIPGFPVVYLSHDCLSYHFCY